MKGRLCISNLMDSSAHLDYGLHHIFLVIDDEIKSLLGILEVEFMGHDTLDVNFTAGNRSNGGRIQVAVTEYRFDIGFFEHNLHKVEVDDILGCESDEHNRSASFDQIRRLLHGMLASCGFNDLI